MAVESLLTTGAQAALVCFDSVRALAGRALHGLAINISRLLLVKLWLAVCMGGYARVCVCIHEHKIQWAFFC